MTADENGRGRFHLTRAVPVFRFRAHMTANRNDRLRRAIEAARCPDRARDVSEQIAQLCATLAELMEEQERLDARVLALRRKMEAEGTFPAEEG